MKTIRAAVTAVVLMARGAGGAIWATPVTKASTVETVSIAPGQAISIATPQFLQRGKRYSFSWPGGGPPQTFMIKEVRSDGWVLVEVAEENVDPSYVPLGSIPTRWLNVGIATSIQEMRPLLY